MLTRFSQCAFFFILMAGLVTPVQAEEPTLLKYKLEKGSQFITRVKMENKTSQTINGMESVVEITQTSFDIRVIDDVDADGTAKIKTKTERLKQNTKLPPLGDYEFDSQKTERDKSSMLGAALTPLYERLVGSELQFEVTPRGTVKSLTGYSQLVGDLVKANPLTSQFAGGGTDGAAKLGVQGQWVVFPDKPVKPGEKWENPFETEMAGLGIIKGKETVTFLALENRNGHSIAKLSVSNDTSFDLNIEMNGAKVTGKVSTSNSQGTAEFDLTAGRLVSQKGTLTLTGPLTVAVNGATFPIQLTQTIASEQTLLDKLPE